MASYLELLKEGILAKDMAIIKKAYEGMSGEKIVERHGINGLDENEYIARPNAKLNETNADGNGILTKKKPTKISNVNLFKDDGEFGDKPVVPLKKPSPDKKTGYFIDIRCNKCNKMFSVSKRALPISLNGISGREQINMEGYTCDECISKRR